MTEEGRRKKEEGRPRRRDNNKKEEEGGGRKKKKEEAVFLVHPDQQKEFLTKIIDVNDKIIFYESSVLKTRFFQRWSSHKAKWKWGDR